MSLIQNQSKSYDIGRRKRSLRVPHGIGARGSVWYAQGGCVGRRCRGAEIARVVERRNHDREVAGSNPILAEILYVVSLSKVLNPSCSSRLAEIRY